MEWVTSVWVEFRILALSQYSYFWSEYWPSINTCIYCQNNGSLSIFKCTVRILVSCGKNVEFPFFQLSSEYFFLLQIFLNLKLGLVDLKQTSSYLVKWYFVLKYFKKVLCLLWQDEQPYQQGLLMFVGVLGAIMQSFSQKPMER